MSTNEFIEFIKTIKSLGPDEKEKYIALVNDGQDPAEILDMIEDDIQGKIIKEFDEAGIDVTQEPEFKAAYQEMTDEFKAAEEEYEQKISEIDKEASQIEEEGTKEMDNVKMEAIRANISGASSEK